MTQHPSSLSAARWSISTVFLLNGAGIGLWAAHVPVVQARAGIDTAMLSMVLLTIAAGALLAMPLMGGFTARWGTRRMVLLSGFAFAAFSAVMALMTPVILIGGMTLGVMQQVIRAFGRVEVHPAARLVAALLELPRQPFADLA